MRRWQEAGLFLGVILLATATSGRGQQQVISGGGVYLGTAPARTDCNIEVTAAKAVVLRGCDMTRGFEPNPVIVQRQDGAVELRFLQPANYSTSVTTGSFPTTTAK